MLNRCGERGHPCLVPDLSGKALSFCPLSMMLAVGLSYMAFMILRNAPSIPTLLSVFIRNGCWILSNAFPTSIHMIMLFFCLCCCLCDVLCLLICEYCTILHHWDASQFVMVYDLFNVLVDGVCNILLRIFTSMFISDIGLKFSFFVVSSSGFVIRMMVAS